MGFNHPREFAQTASQQRAVVVLGVGRSGTSAITRGLQALGVEPGDQLRPGGGKNPTGFFEDEDLLTLNKRLRKALGLRAESVSLVEPHQWQTPAVRFFQQEAIETIRRRFGRYSLWGYKYAGTLRHSRFTTEDLEQNPRVNSLTQEAYRWLYRLATDEVDPYSPELWQDWSRIENALTDLTPILRHLDHVEAELRRARRSVLGPLQAVPQMWQNLRQNWPLPRLVTRLRLLRSSLQSPSIVE